MKSSQLLRMFSGATNWNAAAYFIYKCTTTCITFFLYNKLDQATFSLYGNFNSIIFFMLLWLDLGFSKSIATFCPFYEQSSHAFKQFITTIVRYKTIALCLSLPIYTYIMHNYLSYSTTCHQDAFFYVGMLLLITEGINNAVRLVYHAHFAQKRYTIAQACTLMVELIVSFFVLTFYGNELLLLGILIAKISAQSILMVLTLYDASTLYATPIVSHHNVQTLDYQHIHKQFMLHSVIMWFNTGCKSLTERNFLLPCFTYIFGPAVANVFKIANEGALLFYRIVIKTIGSSDTALFAHIVTMGSTKSTWQIAFKKVITKIAALCIPFFGIAWYMYYYDTLLIASDNTYVFHIFFIICIALLSEVVCSPAERFLEVNFDYFYLLIAYMPYFIMLIALFTTPVMTSIGLLNTIVCIHGVRLVSSFLMICIARIRYGLTDTRTYITLLFACVCIVFTYTHIP